MEEALIQVYRRRRIKCDEAKPNCLKCIKHSGSCEGYQDKPRVTTNRAEKESRKAGSGQSRASVTTFILLPRVLRESAFSTQAEQEYFSVWYHAKDFGGSLFPNRLFTTSIAQIGSQEPSVRYAIIALGCMKLALAGELSSGTLKKAKSESFHYRQALIHYGKSLGVLRKSAPGECCLRNTMMCCILFIAFEALCNNKKIVVKHISHGVALVHQYLDATGNINDEMARRSSVDNAVDNELIQMFYRLDCHSRSINIFRNPGNKLEACHTPCTTHEISQPAPSAFKDPGEARQSFVATQHLLANLSRHMTHFCASYTTDAEETTTDIIGVRGRAYSLALRNHCLIHLLGWGRAFQPLFDRARKSRHVAPDEHRQVLYLRVEYLWTYCSIVTARFEDCESVTRCTPHFQEMVRLADRLLSRGISLSSPNAARDNKKNVSPEPFAIEEGLVLALFISAIKCRDDRTGRRAVDLLARHQARNGLFDSRECHALAVWSLALEEECIRASLPEAEYWRVMRSRQASFGESDTKPRVRALHPVNGHFVYREDTISW
ncbi:hypothetical protein PG994_000838 [Apiospora phragmitis]|uniref:Zn(2)-C6 fungal-type domain-containing protein n=1 Tax=Apiospora phragmitis TaxID=2905665 RepID=A0ABR1X7G9_9PEZI